MGRARDNTASKRSPWLPHHRADRPGLAAGNARQQAERGTFDPAYLNYTLGKLMIRKLREEWAAPHGGRQAWREFHD